MPARCTKSSARRAGPHRRQKPCTDPGRNPRGTLGFSGQRNFRGESAHGGRQEAAGAAGRGRINVHEDYEVQYWTKELGVSKERLEQLVKDRGASADAVRQALRKKQHA
jgi:hypothetical protein